MGYERTLAWNPRIAVLISSFARPTDLIRQVLSMGMNQTYKNIHLFVSVKGVPESVLYHLITPQFTPLIASGLLTLRWDGNTNQAWNLLDTVKEEEVEEYDLFCKVDDDDYYHPEYLSTYAEALRLSPPHSSLYVSGNYPTIIPISFTHTMDFLFPRNTGFTGWGDMLGMSRKVISHLLTMREDVDLLYADMEKFKYGRDCDLGVQEDRYYFSCMNDLGPCVDVTPLFQRKDISPVIVGQHTIDTSISRGLWKVRKEFFNTVRYVTQDRKDKKREYVLQFANGEVYSLFNGKMVNLSTQEVTGYKSYEDGILTLSTGERYEKDVTGKYVKARRDSGGS